MDTPKKSRLPQPLPRRRHHSHHHRCHRSLDATNHRSRLPMPSSKTKPPRGKTTPRRRHRPIIRSRVSPEEAEMAGSVREECGSKSAMPPGRSRRPQPPPSLVTTQGRDRVFTRAPTPPRLHIIPHQHRQAHQSSSQPKPPPERQTGSPSPSTTRPARAAAP